MAVMRPPWDPYEDRFHYDQLRRMEEHQRMIAEQYRAGLAKYRPPYPENQLPQSIFGEQCPEPPKEKKKQDPKLLLLEE